MLKKNYDGAIELLNQSYKKCPWHPEINYRLAQSFLHKNHDLKALDCLGEAIYYFIEISKVKFNKKNHKLFDLCINLYYENNLFVKQDQFFSGKTFEEQGRIFNNAACGFFREKKYNHAYALFMYAKTSDTRAHEVDDNLEKCCKELGKLGSEYSIN